jgi:6,7-dimethyl-8-ribityllumazine synthase
MKGVHDTFAMPSGIDPAWRIGLIPAVYHRRFVDSLVAEATVTFVEAGLSASGISIHPVLGSFEIPLIGGALARSGTVDALIGFGIVLEGETNHADHIAGEAARAMMDIQVQTGIPFAFEILQVRDLALAEARCFGEHNKGREAAVAVLHSLAQLSKLGSDPIVHIN